MALWTYSPYVAVDREPIKNRQSILGHSVSPLTYFSYHSRIFALKHFLLVKFFSVDVGGNVKSVTGQISIFMTFLLPYLNFIETYFRPNNVPNNVGVAIKYENLNIKSFTY